MTQEERMGASVLSVVVVLLWTTVYGLSSDGETLLKIASEWKASVNWDAKTDPCQWEGVICDAANLHVTELNLSNKALTGPVPSDMSRLVSLVSLDVCGTKDVSNPLRNKVSGDLSPIATLTNLQHLNVSLNILNGQFPSAVLQLSNLVTLRLDNAQLTGEFPRGLSALANLQYLYLGNNSMEGDLPPELGKLVNLKELTMWNNSFNSKIPSELSNLVNLSYLNLRDCKLWGGLPPEFGNLRNMKTLMLYRNNLSGVIPENWQNMKQLEDLELNDNYLTKHFPDWILHETNLNKVDISNNYFYGILPNLNVTLKNTKLTTLNVKCNFFSGIRSGDKPIVSHSGNCFSNLNETKLRIEKNKCGQTISCIEFSKRVPDGVCPPTCPLLQVLVDSTNCVCGMVGGGSQSSKTLKIIAPILGAALFVLVGYMAYSRWRSNVKKQAIDRFGRKIARKDLHEFWEPPKGVQRFSFGELAKATRNFDEDHEIGEGGFGKVFIGVLDNGKKVAIKRASESSVQGSFEFHNEVLLLSRLHHRNLVRLEGFCEDEGLQILVYEYMPKGNLHTLLFLCDDHQTLNWYRRLEIAVGIAQGLDYLHSFADPPVIHRDVKPSNILLDENLVAKLADFGISKATPEFDTHISTTPAGTAGYIDPQYFLRRQLTTASDVYGFGVVLLELLTGRKAIDHTRLDEHNLVEWVKLKLQPEGIENIVDSRLDEGYPRKVYYDAIQLAIECASFNKNDRPSMKAVVSVLESCLWAAGPPPSETPCHPSESFQRKPSKEDYEFNDTGMRDTSISSEAAIPSGFRGSILMPR